MRFIAPAGTYLRPSTLVAGLFGHRPASSARLLAEAISGHTNGHRTFLLTTGRAAMTVTLIALRQLAADESRNEVVIPGYTCYSVAAAVEKAGLVPRLCDVDPVTLSPTADDLRQIDFTRVLAILSANLYGIPNRLSEMESIAREKEVFFLDDAAQALGATYNSRPVGSFGDAGIFSFDKGKNITTLSGGVIISGNARLSSLLERFVGALPPATMRHTFVITCMLLGYSVFLRPNLYAIVRRLPLGLGETPYDPDIALRRYDSALAGLALRQLQDLDCINGERVRNARAMHEQLARIPGVVLPVPLAAASAVYPRLPILVDPNKRDRLVDSLVSAGIGATASYPRALMDVPEVARRLPADQRPTLGARCLSQQILTLPTHHYCPIDLPAVVAGIVDSVK